ncbi:hypothetical protein, partial [Cronobacter sakazakii]|uniref:hypothetical protein n=1 Tax=Cronobacter sakazakii TaxID=28141 RepID=UPI001A9CAD5F
PGTTNLKKPAYGLVFCFWRAGLFIELCSIHSSPPCDSPCGQRDALCKNAPGVLSGPGTTHLKNPPTKRVFAFEEPHAAPPSRVIPPLPLLSVAFIVILAGCSFTG